MFAVKTTPLQKSALFCPYREIVCRGFTKAFETGSPGQFEPVGCVLGPGLLDQALFDLMLIQFSAYQYWPLAGIDATANKALGKAGVTLQTFINQGLDQYRNIGLIKALVDQFVV